MRCMYSSIFVSLQAVMDSPSKSITKIVYAPSDESHNWPIWNLHSDMARKLSS